MCPLFIRVIAQVVGAILKKTKMKFHLSTALMFVELNEPRNAAHNVALLVHDNEGSCSKGGLSPHQIIKVHHYVLTHTA